MNNEKRIWSDNDEEMHEEIVRLARIFSKEYRVEIKSDSSMNKTSTQNRLIDSASADGFRCGVLWVIDNPLKFIKIVVQSFLRRLRFKNQISPLN